jgi:predicted ribosome quality control (RQC) complex YloA/Tae2 family protein
MSLSTHDIALVLEEIGPALQAGWIQKIHQPTDRSLVFEVRAPGQTHRLFLSFAPDACRLHFLSKPSSNPAGPPPFCQFLRARIQGGRIDGFRQIPQDRIVEWLITTKHGPWRLMCEFTGRTANLLVVDNSGMVIRDLNGATGTTGRLYTLQEKRTPQVQDPHPSKFPPPHPSEPFPLSAAIEQYYGDRETTQTLNDARNNRLRIVKKALKKEQRRIEAWQGGLAGAAKFHQYARYGELLKASLESVKKGMDRIVLTDYFDEALPDVAIPLDPTKSAQGNMDDYFRKHRKYLAAEKELRPRIEASRQMIVALRQELEKIESGTWVPPPSPGRRDVLVDRRRHKDRDRQRQGPFRRFTSTDGLPVFVGRNARENDELTFGLANGDDLWLHARGVPGSHVVVRLEKGSEPPVETLRDAATLALLYSDLKKSGKGDVIYTRRKWVKKAKGQAAGAVTVTQEQSLHISLDRKRLAALRERSGLES